MINNTDKNQWIEDVLNSAQGLSRAQAGSGLYDAVVAEISAPKNIRRPQFPVKQWAAAAVLLLLLNVGSVVYFSVSNEQTETPASGNPLAMDIPSASTYNY